MLKTAQIIIALVGIGIVTYFSSWEVSLGIFMMIWANNFDTGGAKC